MKRRAPSQATAEGTRSEGPPFKMNKRQWKAALSRLNLQRDCSAPMSDDSDSCWLCDELEEWNAALNPLQLSLEEQVPGKIWLCSLADKPQFNLKRGSIPYDTALFVAWLPRKHQCIEGIHFSQSMPHLGTCVAPDSVAGLPSNVRHLNFSGNASFDWTLVLDALDPIVQLRGITFDGVRVSGTLAAKAAQLLSANALTVKEVRLCKTEITGSDSNLLMSAIAKCENLTALVFDAGLNLDGMRDFSKLLQSTTTLDKLHLVVRDFNYGYDVTMSDYKQLVAAAGALLKKNTTLTQLCYEGRKEELASILEALQTNDVLKNLEISSDENKEDTLEADITLGKQIGAMLSRNRGLLALTLNECKIDDQCGSVLAQGLMENTTLECLDVSECPMNFNAMLTLCTALEKNKTCTVKIGSFAHWHPLRRTLSEMVARNNCYARVHLLNWGCSDAKPIAASLLEPSLCPTELYLETDYISEKSFQLLCQALSSSLQIRSLTVAFGVVSLVYTASLRKALEKNVSLKSVVLEEYSNSEGAAAVFSAEGLCTNTSVTELTIKCCELGSPYMRSLGQMIASNENLNSVQLVCDEPLPTLGMEFLSEGVVENRFITDFSIDADTPAHSMTAIRASLQRNRVFLHRAVRFALGRNGGKLCAEAFEFLSSRAYFVAKVMKASDMTEAEAKAAVEAAKLFIRHNYLLVNKVFRHKLECHAGNGTQIDQLNFDCLLAITKYLKVSDIIYE